MAKELIKGESYTREDIENAGLTLFKSLSAVLIYKKDDLIYWFNKNDKAGKFDLNLVYKNN
jgi:hypothetical protein